MNPRPMRFSESWKMRGFGVVQNLFGRIALIRGAGDGRIGRMHQSAQQRLVAHDLDVVLNARTVRHPVHQPRNVADVADGSPALCGAAVPQSA